MYENISYESILQRMLDRVPESMDKREGSIIYDALAPAAMELMRMYIELKRVSDESYGDTASRDYLMRRADERGLKPYPATKAVLKAQITPETVEIPIGSRFNLNELNYVVISKESATDYTVECETAGLAGNGYFGPLIPIDYIADLESIEITELLIPGEDEEETEAFRKRYLDSFQSQAFGGNKADYIEKTNKVKGVGSCKVYPIWNGGGTVKLVILDSKYDVPSAEVVSQVQLAVDPVGHTGEGMGFAPIGHKVTVEGATPLQINVQSHFVFVEGFDFPSAEASIKQAISDYLAELRKAWGDEDDLIVRISQIETRLLALPQILDIENTIINGASKNILLEDNVVPTIGGVTNV